MSARVRFCYWCRQFAILDAKPDDHVEICVVGAVQIAKINGIEGSVGEGICPPCRTRTLSEELKTKGVAR